MFFRQSYGFCALLTPLFSIHTLALYNCVSLDQIPSITVLNMHWTKQWKMGNNKKMRQGRVMLLVECTPSYYPLPIWLMDGQCSDVSGLWAISMFSFLSLRANYSFLVSKLLFIGWRSLFSICSCVPLVCSFSFWSVSFAGDFS